MHRISYRLLSLLWGPGCHFVARAVAVNILPCELLDSGGGAASLSDRRWGAGGHSDYPPNVKDLLRFFRQIIQRRYEYHPFRFFFAPLLVLGKDLLADLDRIDKEELFLWFPEAGCTSFPSPLEALPALTAIALALFLEPLRFFCSDLAW